MEAINAAPLADAVRDRAPGAPLDRIEAGRALSEELTAGADELIGQFMAEARQAGCSWTEIGQRIGGVQAGGPAAVLPVARGSPGGPAAQAAVAGLPA